MGDAFLKLHRGYFQESYLKVLWLFNRKKSKNFYLYYTIVAKRMLSEWIYDYRKLIDACI